MDHVIFLHFGGSVTEKFELVGMRRQVVMFQNRPSFNDLVARVRAVMNVGCDMCLHGSYDMGGNRPIYVILLLRSEDEWLLYKSCASESGLKGAEVVVEIAQLPSGEITVQEMGVTTEEIVVGPIVMEQASQEELHGATHRASLGSELVKTNSEALNLAVVTDEFDDETFDENVDTEAHIEEDDEAGMSESDEENVQPTMDTTPDAPVDTVDEDNEPNDLTCSRINWSSYYLEEELRALKVKLINLQDYPNNKNISHIESTVCDSAIVDDEGNLRVGEEVIKMGQLFERLDDVKFFFQDYAVCYHRPYYVAKSNKDV
jgi:hypothetical protein